MGKQNSIHAVRVRENGQKRTKFYRDCKSPDDAAAKYKGKGEIISVRKMGIEKLYGFGAFFRLGDDLLKEIKNEEFIEIAQARANHERETERNIKRREYDERNIKRREYDAGQRRPATD